MICVLEQEEDFTVKAANLNEVCSFINCITAISSS